MRVLYLFMYLFTRNPKWLSKRLELIRGKFVADGERLRDSVR